MSDIDINLETNAEPISVEAFDRKERAMTEVKSDRKATEASREMLLDHMSLLLEHEREHGATPAGLQAMTGAAALLGAGD